MNKITLFASFALLFISSIGFSQNERIEFKQRPAEFELYEYRNDSIFPLKTPVQNTTSRVFYICSIFIIFTKYFFGDMYK